MKFTRSKIDDMDEKIKAARVTLGQYFKERREELGYTTDQVGTAVGISANTVKGIETGRFAWDIDTNLLMCRTLQIKPYFALISDDADEGTHIAEIDDPERYHGFYTAENEMLYPGQLAIVKLTHPRMFVRFQYDEAFFASFEEWKAHMVKLEWLDPDDTGSDNEDYYLTECWNFLALRERHDDEFDDEDY